MTQEFTPEMLKAVDRVQKLLNLASNNPNKEEADSAAAKAQEILTSFNLDIAMVERAGGAASGKREEMHERGGFYKWQAELWQAVAELNFCMYWCQEYYIPQKERHIAEGRSTLRKQKRHRLIGRTLNTTATKLMATYLEEAIERAVRDNAGITVKTQHSNYANSFRKGCVAELTRKIGERYHERLEEERAKTRAATPTQNHAPQPGSTALTLTDYITSEEEANYDFIHGEGASARNRASHAAWEERYRLKQAEEAAWALANPIEAKAKAAAEQAASDAYWRKHRNRGGAGPKDNTDHEAYSRGRVAGKAIGLDQQVTNNPTKKLS
jgi:hypothetical protein